MFYEWTNEWENSCTISKFPPRSHGPCAPHPCPPSPLFSDSHFLTVVFLKQGCCKGILSTKWSWSGLSMWWHPGFPHSSFPWASFYQEGRDGDISVCVSVCAGEGVLRLRAGGWHVTHTHPNSPSRSQVLQAEEGWESCGTFIIKMGDLDLWLQIIETHLNTHKEKRKACIVHITWNSRGSSAFRYE